MRHLIADDKLMARRRLDHVDAMRPVKQAGVISTHAILYFAPAAASAGSGAALLLLHVSREGFFFISACMLTYAYADLNRAGLRRFYWRRFLSVGIPYLCWSVIYFLCTLPVSHYPSTTVVFKGLASIVETGYYQLYFLLVIMQFYLVFPLVLVLLRRTRGHGRDRDRYALESVLARTPLAVPLTGRTQVPWRRPRRFPPHPVVLGDQGGVEPLAQGVAGSWHA